MDCDKSEKNDGTVLRRNIAPFPHLRILRSMTRHSRLKWEHPFSVVPMELVEKILSFLPLEDLARARLWSRSFSVLLQSPRSAASIYVSIHLPSDGDTQLPPPEALKFYLSAVSHLSLPGLSTDQLSTILPHLGYQKHLTSLDLSFTQVSTVLLFPASTTTSGYYTQLRELNLKGCRHFLDASPLAHLPKLSVLDLSWSGVIYLLPPDYSTSTSAELESLPFMHLSSLSLSSTTLLAPPSPAATPAPTAAVLSRPTTPQRRSPSPQLSNPPSPPQSLLDFLSSLPASLRSLDLSWMGLEESSLEYISVGTSSTSLEIDMRANERLTKKGVRRFEKRLEGKGVKVVKDEMMLESEEVADVRNFVMMLAGLGSR